MPSRARWRSILQYRRLAVGASDEVFVARHGWLVPKWDVVPHARTQSVRLTARAVAASASACQRPCRFDARPCRIAAKQRDESTSATDRRGAVTCARWRRGQLPRQTSGC